MSVRKDDPERRTVEMEVEVPGTPEEVWRAIATGPGITAWFVPSEVEERVGGAVVFHLGPGMDSSGRVTAWEPPVRFAYEEPDWSPGAPPLATEFIVEARAGGSCVVRLVTSLFTRSGEWDDQLESMESGWPGFFRILRLYLAHFRGRPCAAFRVMGRGAGTEAEAWTALAASLGFAGAAAGGRWSAPAGAPPLAGTVERIDEGEAAHDILLRIDAPAPGIAYLGAFAWGGMVHVLFSLWHYGDGASDAAARAEPAWQAWMDEHFPTPAEAGTAA